MLMIGPLGSGKTMLASRLPGILPPMTETEALESAAIQMISYSGFAYTQWMRRPFRTPHHTASGVALVGGGSQPRPGEISLAHNGFVLLDELPEFERRVLEVLREPIESGKIVISRAARQAEFPAKFQLIVDSYYLYLHVVTLAITMVVADALQTRYYVIAIKFLAFTGSY